MRNRIRALRLQAGLTQAEAALRAGVPESTFARLDANPRASIPLDRAAQIAAALNVKLLDLVPTQ